MNSNSPLSSRRSILFGICFGFLGGFVAPRRVFAASIAGEADWDLPEKTWKERLPLDVYRA